MQMTALTGEVFWNQALGLPSAEELVDYRIAKPHSHHHYSHSCDCGDLDLHTWPFDYTGFQDLDDWLQLISATYHWLSARLRFDCIVTPSFPQYYGAVNPPVDVIWLYWGWLLCFVVLVKVT